MTYVKSADPNAPTHESVQAQIDAATKPLHQKIDDQAKVIEELKTRIAVLEYAAQPKTMHEALTTPSPMMQALSGKKR